MSTYHISKTEIERRKKAFTALILFFLLGTILASVDFIITNPQLASILILSLSALFLISRIYIFRVFESYLLMKFEIGDDHLERIETNVSEKLLIKDISKIKIKQTSRGNIRDIKISLNTGRVMVINGVEEFEELANELVKKLDPKVMVKKTQEPIDYDHILFYPIFALLVSISSVNLFKYILSLEYSNLKPVYYGFSIYSIIMGIYFLVAKPIARSNGAKEKYADYLLGGIFLIAGLLILYVI